MSKDYGTAVSQRGYDVKNCADRFLVYSSAFQTLKIFSSHSVSTVIPSETEGAYSASASTDYFTSASHNLNDGDKIEFNDHGDPLPSPIIEDMFYYVINKTTDIFQVSLTPGGSAVNLTTNTSSSDARWEKNFNLITVAHDLGYLSPFFVIYNGSSTTGQENSYLNANSEGTELSPNNYEDRLELHIGDRFDLLSGSQIGDTVYFTIYIFLEDFSTIAQNTINTGISSGSSLNDYGIRISKEGYDVKDCTDEQCVLSSSLFTQIIHKKDIFQTPADIRDNFTVNASTDVFTSSGHGLSNGSILELDSSDTLPSPLSDSIDYYVIDVTTNTFKVSLTEGGTAVNITNTGVGTHDFRTLTPPITHDLGYPPAYLLYELQDDGNGEYLEMCNTSIDDEKIDISKYATDETYYYIIFKQKND